LVLSGTSALLMSSESEGNRESPAADPNGNSPDLDNDHEHRVQSKSRTNSEGKSLIVLCLQSLREIFE
jgi:hypothetical protein